MIVSGLVCVMCVRDVCVHQVCVWLHVAHAVDPARIKCNQHITGAAIRMTHTIASGVVIASPRH